MSVLRGALGFLAGVATVAAARAAQKSYENNRNADAAFFTTILAITGSTAAHCLLKEIGELQELRGMESRRVLRDHEYD